MTKKRILCMLLALVLIFPLLLIKTPKVEAAVTKVEKTRAIAVVFDDSASMYQNHNKRWGYATYAMEVFAAMLKDKGENKPTPDKMMIFPMNGMTVNGVSYPAGSYYELIGPAKARDIEKIQAVGPNWGTPISSIDKACKQLLATTGVDERYLIVLTDGDSFDGKSKDETKVNVSNKLHECAAKDGITKVMYLGVDVHPDYQPEVKDSNKESFRVASFENTQKVLSEMSNEIFGRNTLPGNCYNASSKSVKLDVTSKELIVFVQGENVSDVSLPVGTKVREEKVKYSELGYSRGDDFEIAKELQGMIVTYKDVPVGTHKLTYKSTNEATVSFYYEPDVELRAVFKDGEGYEVDPKKDELYAGTYTFEYMLVDKGTQKPVDSNLVGSGKLLGDVTSKVTPYLKKKGADSFEQLAPATGKHSGKVEITLEAGDELKAEFDLTYLDDYHIHNSSEELGWPEGGLKITPRPVGQFELKLSQGREYNMSSFEKEATFKLTAYYEGYQIKGEGLKNVSDPEISLVGGGVKTECTRDEDGFTIKLSYDGDIADVTAGARTLNAKATYTNEDGEAKSAETSTAFSLKDDSQGLGIAIALEQEYYVNSKLEESAPIVLNLTMGGRPLTKDQFKNVHEVKLFIDDVDVSAGLKKDEAKGCYTYKLSKDDNLSDGAHSLKATVTGVDTFGNDSSAQAEGTFKTDPLPKWVYVLFWILIILAVIGLFLAIMSQKRLPKKMIMANEGKFSVNGEKVLSEVTSRATGCKKKFGSLTVNSPEYSRNPMAACSFSLELEAVDNRWTKTAARRAAVKKVRVGDISQVRFVEIDGTRLTPDKVTGELVVRGSSVEETYPIIISSNSTFSMATEITGFGFGGDVSCKMNGEFEFH